MGLCKRTSFGHALFSLPSIKIIRFFDLGLHCHKLSMCAGSIHKDSSSLKKYYAFEIS